MIKARYVRRVLHLKVYSHACASYGFWLSWEVFMLLVEWNLIFCIIGVLSYSSFFMVPSLRIHFLKNRRGEHFSFHISGHRHSMNLPSQCPFCGFSFCFSCSVLSLHVIACTEFCCSCTWSPHNKLVTEVESIKRAKVIVQDILSTWDYASLQIRSRLNKFSLIWLQCYC